MIDDEFVARADMCAKPTSKGAASDLRLMTEEEIEAAALSDPDALPLTPEDLKRMKRVPQVKVIRRALD